MATYVVGDIHGCFEQLQNLLNKVNFNPSSDNLWCIGDLVNGGPDSDKVLNYLQSLPNCLSVLGNHDITLLAVACQQIDMPKDRDSDMQCVLDASNKDNLIKWLVSQPLVHYDKNFNVLLVHAGVIPNWDLTAILELANEAKDIISKNLDVTYANLFKNTPDTWSDDLTGYERLRFIINCFTRIRFCTSDGKLDLTNKGKIIQAPPGYSAWFTLLNKLDPNLKIIFGHWAALEGNIEFKNIVALDTGCMWGGKLTALRLDDWQFFSVDGLSK